MFYRIGSVGVSLIMNDKMTEVKKRELFWNLLMSDWLWVDSLGSDKVF